MPTPTPEQLFLDNLRDDISDLPARERREIRRCHKQLQEVMDNVGEEFGNVGLALLNAELAAEKAED